MLNAIIEELTEDQKADILAYFNGELFSELAGLEELDDFAILRKRVLEVAAKLRAGEGAYT